MLARVGNKYDGWLKNNLPLLSINQSMINQSIHQSLFVSGNEIHIAIGLSGLCLIGAI